MGKATRWIRSLFGAKKASSGSNRSASRRQSKTYGPSKTGEFSSGSPYPESLDANKHAIAVAAATAAVAEAAIAAAHAAAEVVRLTTGGSSGGGNRPYYGGERRREVAAVKIQSAFRAYLARRALRALKALVKLQALVRGHIVRKQSADMLRRMQAMARVQARASAHRTTSSISSSRSSRSYHHPRSSSMSNAKSYFGQERDRQMGPNFLQMEETSWNNKYGRSDDEKGDKILEVDTWMPRFNPSPSDESTYDSYKTPKKPQKHLGSMLIREAEYTPRVYSASYRPGSSHKQSPFTSVSRDECSRSLFGDYPSHPNYMANTESSRAKLRSHSAPRQRSRLFEKSGSTRHLWDYLDTKSERDF